MSGQPSDNRDKTQIGAQVAQAGRTTAADARPAIAREAIAGAAELLGGAEGLAEWVKADPKNEEKFWTSLYPKLIPLQAAAKGAEPPSIAAAIEAARKRAWGPRGAPAYRAAPEPTTTAPTDAACEGDTP